ncbi:MAG: hypothetical protein ACREXP_26885 [Steroidobacteraceae bacterium]
MISERAAIFRELSGAGDAVRRPQSARRQLMVCLRGIVEVTAADGQKRRITPGQFVLLEDLTGKGHITHSAGAEDHVAFAVPLADSILARK